MIFSRFNHATLCSVTFLYERILLTAFYSYGGFFFQRQVFSALSQISKHSVDLAEMVVEADIFPAVLSCLKDSDDYVKKNVATLIREISKHTPEVNKFQSLA